MQTLLYATSHLRSLLRVRNFLILRSTRTNRSERKYGGLIARLKPYGLWSPMFLRCVFHAKLFWIAFNGPRAISPSCKLQSFHGREGHRGVWFSFSRRAIAEMSFVEILQQKLQNYLRAFASWRGINTNDGSSHISYNTKVESVQKRYVKDRSRTDWTWKLHQIQQERRGQHRFGPSSTKSNL